MSRKKILISFGTRPEVIKLAPVIKELKQSSHEIRILHTGQHSELVKPMLDIFELSPDLDMRVMKEGQDLFDLTEALTPKLKKYLKAENPDYIIVQGDTTSSYLTAISAYYLQIPVLHVEAGLRSHQPYDPFPEEMNRKLISQIATAHFAPTPLNRDNLLNEGINSHSIYVTGNTVIDALNLIRSSDAFNDSPLSILSHISEEQDLLLLTTHRRENHGAPMERIFESIRELLTQHDHLEVIFPMHPNPKIEQALSKVKIDHSRFHLLSPLGYLPFLKLIERADIILTDSGGIQEEASALGKPVLVLRNETERQELIDSGLGILTGTDTQKIIAEANTILKGSADQPPPSSVFGEGNAARKIRDIIENQL
ncbi:MAG: UDP-N-acetylglucosamine 2-epimerase (non-hydrolyzing) [Balneolaceae bacterium]|nr:UDP-N-acetylglucosamine 2-epimerase (non-hydrolyzing) [Balneolaceae bacterium]